MLKTPHSSEKRLASKAPDAVQILIDPTRALDRQVISGEVAAGSVLAVGLDIGIGLAAR